MTDFLIGIIDTFLLVLWFALIGRAILSWFPIDPRNPVFTLLYQVTEPVLQPIRRVMPRMGGIDLSPLIAIVLIILLKQLLEAAS